MSKKYIPPLDVLCRALGLPVPIAEHKFHSKRRWRFDYAFLDHKLAVEIEGGIWIGYKGKNGRGQGGKNNYGQGGRHNRGQGFINDMEKYNAATELGWRVLRYEPDKVDIGQIEKCLIESKSEH